MPSLGGGKLVTGEVLRPARHGLMAGRAEYPRDREALRDVLGVVPGVVLVLVLRRHLE